MRHSCIASLRVIHASKERETLHNIPDLAISMACSHLCVLFSSCVYIHTAHTQPTSATHSSTGRLLRETYAVITWPAAGRPVGVASRLSHSCMRAIRACYTPPTWERVWLVSAPDPHVTPSRKRVRYLNVRFPGCAESACERELCNST